MTLPADYVHARMGDPEMRVRDAGHAIAAVLITDAVRPDPIPLDSELYREHLGRRLLRELEERGYSVTFTGRVPR